MRSHSSVDTASSHDRSGRTISTIAAALLVVAMLASAPAEAGYERDFESGSLIIPMDLAYQEDGMFQAYGLLFQLLRHGITVYWVIDPDKSWHHADCDSSGDECAWPCASGSTDKCSYPTASPDFYASATVLWDGQGGATGATITEHGYRAGPFVIDTSDRDEALAIVDVWNDPDTWAAATWAERTVFNIVTVHQTTATFTGYVRKEMVVAPTIAVFSDGHEDIATGYLRAAGIPQSNAMEFPAGNCGDDDCGPGTDNPDMLTVPSVMGEMGTCDAMNYDHKNGALFTADGLPAYCQIMSMHWDVSKRNEVECNGGRCPDLEADCAGETITYHGHEVVAEVRKFLGYPVHFFAECQAVNAYENLVPDPAWPYLDDDERKGHFLTEIGVPPLCPVGDECTEDGFACETDGCGSGVDCCLPTDDRELGAGFLIADQPDSATLKILHPDVAYNQFDGRFATEGGSEPAYNLAEFMGAGYLLDREVTFITGPDGPGDQDVWMTGYMEGECDIVGDDDVGIPSGECNSGKVSYLGGHRYSTDPTSDNSRGTRLFLNALFEADCVTSVGQPDMALALQGDVMLVAVSFPVESTYTSAFTNQGRGAALDADLTTKIPEGVTMVEAESGGTTLLNGVGWHIGSISGNPPLAGDPSNTGGRWATLSFAAEGAYDIDLSISYWVGLSEIDASRTVTINVGIDSDGDGIIDSLDPYPNDDHACGDSDGDTCDDCAVAGTSEPDNDGPDADADGICDAGEDDIPGDGDDAGGCGCASSRPQDAAAGLILMLLLALLRRRRSSSTARGAT